ncbi:hypothetical protein VM1G_05997 [Cytospora mali]|uniref:Uncharacterized protein n=1 Tax=Cytospora mali TaxID=578113 RepID=A0A194W1J1_CYTMA|nr:hypothetical protein VM1G_05997 [Valsa mali]
MRAHIQYLLLLIGFVSLATADWFRHEVREVEGGIEARNGDEDAAGELLDLLDALEDAEHHHHDNDNDDNDDNAETTVTEILKQTVTAAAANSNNTAPVTVTLNGTGAAATSDINAQPFSFLTTTVYAQASSLLPSSTLESALTLGIGTSTAPAAAAAATGTALAANNPAAVTPAAVDSTSSSSKQPDIDTNGLTLVTALSLGSLVQQTALPVKV